MLSENPQHARKSQCVSQAAHHTDTGGDPTGLEGVRRANSRVPAASEAGIADAWPRLDEELPACQQLHCSSSVRPCTAYFPPRVGVELF